MIRPVTINDAAQIAEIYRYYITDTLVTFEEVVIDEEEVANRIRKVGDLGLPWIVWEEGGVVKGYAYASKWRERSAFLYTVESAIYLDHREMGNGIGTKLYRSLLDLLRESKMHTVMGMITIPNPGSIHLHEKLGFKKVAEYSQVGWKFDQWIDVQCWQLMLGSK